MLGSSGYVLEYGVHVLGFSMVIMGQAHLRFTSCPMIPASIHTYFTLSVSGFGTKDVVFRIQCVMFKVFVFGVFDEGFDNSSQTPAP